VYFFLGKTIIFFNLPLNELTDMFALGLFLPIPFSLHKIGSTISTGACAKVNRDTALGAFKRRCAMTTQSPIKKNGFQFKSCYESIVYAFVYVYD